MITSYELQAIHQARTGELERREREVPAGSDAAPRSSGASEGISKAPYTPNHIPEGTRVWNVCLSIFLLGYGTFGLMAGWLYIPGKRGGLMLHGPAVWIMCVAMVCAVLNLLSVLADHYDTRNNEHHYKDFARLTHGGAVVFAIIACLCTS